MKDLKTNTTSLKKIEVDSPNAANQTTILKKHDDRPQTSVKQKEISGRI